MAENTAKKVRICDNNIRTGAAAWIRTVAAALVLACFGLVGPFGRIYAAAEEPTATVCPEGQQETAGAEQPVVDSEVAGAEQPVVDSEVAGADGIEVNTDIEEDREGNLLGSGDNAAGSAGGSGLTAFSEELGRKAKTPENDTLLGGIMEAAGKNIGVVRTTYGLPAMTGNEALGRICSYAAVKAYIGEISEKGSGILEAESFVAGASENVTGAFAFTMGNFRCDDIDVLAEHIIKSILKTEENLLLTKGNTQFGIGIAVIEGRAYVVVCSAKAGEVTDKVPVPMFVKTGFGENPDSVIKGGTVLLKKGSTLNEEKIREGLIFYKGNPEEFRISWDKTAINTAECGEFPLYVSVFAPNGTSVLTGITVSVTEGGKPIIESDEIELPPLPEGEIWNLAKYVNVFDSAKVREIITEPVFLSHGDFTETETEGENGEVIRKLLSREITVTVTNIFGEQTVRKMRAVLQEDDMSNVPFQILTEKIMLNPSGRLYKGTVSLKTEFGIAFSRGGHGLIGITGGLEDIEYIYRFDIKDESGTVRTHTTDRGFLAWNPYTSGKNTVTITVSEKLTGDIAARYIFETSVAEKSETVYNTPMLIVTEESGLFIDKEKGMLTGVRPETEAQALLPLLITYDKSKTAYVVILCEEEEITGDNILGTGYEIVLTDGTEEYLRIKIVVTGDINGDGEVGIADFAKMRQELLKGGLLEDEFAAAGDLNGDGEIGIADFAKMRQYLLGKIEL